MSENTTIGGLTIAGSIGPTQSEQPLSLLRWSSGGRLQQRWQIITYAHGMNPTQIQEEWRDVPTEQG